MNLLKHWNKHTWITIFGAAVFVLIIFAIKFLPFMLGYYGPPQFPPTAVTALVVTEADWADSLDLIGSLKAKNGANFSAEESGRVAEIRFEPGTSVKAGDLLLRLDTGVEEAQLQAARAKKDLARLTFERTSRMRLNNSVPQQSLDEAKAALNQTEGEQHALEEVIRRKTVVAPFAGQVGVRLVSIGEFVAQGKELVSLYDVNALLLDFSFPQSKLSEVAVGQEVFFTADSFPGEVFTGKVNALNPDVNTLSRNIWGQAEVTNTDRKLKPGMFVKVEVRSNLKKKIIPVPASSISYAPYGDSIYVIEPAVAENQPRILRQQIVRLGKMRGDQVAILSGLKSGEEIVTSGVFKLRPGEPVIINNSVTPSNDPNPSPVER